MTDKLWLDMKPQPNDTTCGPTCLQAVYGFYGDARSLPQVIAEVPDLTGGGTLSVFLGIHALESGYRATLFTYNLHLFDPTWFDSRADLPAKLREQARLKDDSKLRIATEAYLRFLELGGKVRHEELRPALLRRYLSRGQPVLTGLSATYLYGCAREDERTDYDDVGGYPQGHFVVLVGYDRKKREVQVADPMHDNPYAGAPYYTIGVDRVVGAILLGVLTYDATLLIVEPTSRSR